MATQTKKITIDTAAIFFGKVIGLLFGMVRLSYLATYLSLANFGILNFALYFCSLFQVLFDFGMSQLLTRDVARDLSRSRELVGKIVFLKIIVVLIAGTVVGLIGILLHFDRQTNWAILLTTVVFAINGLSMIFLSAFQAHRKMTLVSISNIFNDLTLSLFVILLIRDYPSVIMVLILGIVVSFVNLLFLAIVYVKSVGMPKLIIDRKLWSDFMKESAPIAISSVGISMYTFVGPTVLKYTRGDNEIGIYTAGYKLISILMLIPLTLAQIVYPIFSEFFITAKDKLVRALQDSLRVITSISFPLVVGTILLAGKIFQLLYPPQFMQGVGVLQLTVIGSLWSFMNAITFTFLLAVNRQSFLMVVSMALGIVMSLASFIVVPLYGFISLPILLIVTDFLNFTFHRWYLVKNGYGGYSMFFLIKPCIASTVMGGVLWFFLSVNIFILIPLGILVYFVVLYALRGFGDQEKEIIRGICKKVTNGKMKGVE